MKTKPETWTVENIINESSNAQLAPNLEYQRGIVWQKTQQQMLIDSLLRGYHLPVFYFHVIRVPGRHGENTRFEIIDGQQRVNSITAFYKGEFTLLDPAARNSRFPQHLREHPCEWANLSFDQMSSDQRDRFMRSEVTVAEIVNASINEARDLFVRLQQGSDLTAQERRDALPGEFGGAVERIAGRRGSSHGHALFQGVMRMKPNTDRGRTRQFVAQLMAIFFEIEESTRFADLSKASIDKLYYNYMELQSKSDVVERFERVLNDVYESLRGWQGRGLPNHLLLHLMVMWQQLEGNYTNAWKSKVLNCVEDFMIELSEANALFKSGNANSFYNYYLSLTKGGGSDKRDIIELRHLYFMDWIQKRIELVRIDRRSPIDPLDRHLVYWKSNRRCAYASNADICGDDRRMSFEIGEVHHVMPISKGGANTLNNLVWTHPDCNRKIGANYVPPPGWEVPID